MSIFATQEEVIRCRSVVLEGAADRDVLGDLSQIIDHICIDKTLKTFFIRANTLWIYSSVLHPVFA